MDITLHNLTPKQAEYAQILWDCETMEDAEDFIESLPTDAEQQDAQLVMELMIIEILEQRIEGPGDTKHAKKILKQFAK